MHYVTLYAIYPYLDTAPADYPRAVEFLFASPGSARVVSVETDGSRVVRFESDGYRQGAGGWSDRQMADDVASFAAAYVERPDEFDRTPADIEQQHAAWWVRHGDAITSATREE